MGLKNKKTALSILIMLIIILLIIDPKRNINACFDGLSLWSTAILPTLLPFFFLTGILSSLGFLQKVGKLLSPITTTLFKTDGISGYVYILSIISGYPVGAKTTADLYENGTITKEQAFKITTFTSTSGPLFIIGTVGANMYGSAKLGYLILISHILGAFLNGLLYRNKFLTTTYQKIITFNNKNPLEDTMYNAIKSVLIVGGYVAIFYMIISMLNNFNILYPFSKFLSLITPLSQLECGALINGFIEVTRGCVDLSQINIPQFRLLVFSTGLISFGGVSIFLQALTFLKRFDISTKFYLTTKITQTILSVLIALILGFIFM